MRKVIFTESQIKRILSEDDLIGLTGVYNGDLDNDATPYDSEVSDTDMLDSGDYGKPVDGDEFFDIAAPKSMFGYRGGGLFEGKKKRDLRESNQEMRDNRTMFKVGSNTRNVLSFVKNNGCNSRMVQNMNDEYNMKPDTAYKRIHDLEELKKDDKNAFIARGGYNLLMGLKAAAKNNENLSKTRKEIKKRYNLGDVTPKIENGIKRRGTQHTKKDNTVNANVTFKYEY